MSDSPLSVIEESILEDSEIQTPNSDLGFPALFEVLPTNDLPLSESQSPSFDLGFPILFEARDLPPSGKQRHRAELGFLALFDASGCDDKTRALAEELKALEMAYDETKEMKPHTEFIMRVLLPLYFDMVRSFH